MKGHLTVITGCNYPCVAQIDTIPGHDRILIPNIGCHDGFYCI